MAREARGWIALAALLLSTAAVARAEPRPYRGPLPLDFDGHWDMDTSVHVHDDLPVGFAPFADIDGVLTFLGDPLAYGYTGDVWTYDGMHPLPASEGGGYCGIRGPHRHAFAPEGGAYRREDGGAYVFTGALRGGVPIYRPASLAPDEPVAPPPPAPAVGATYWSYYPGYYGAPACVYATDRDGHRHLTYGSWGCPAVVDMRDRDDRRHRRHRRRRGRYGGPRSASRWYAPPARPAPPPPRDVVVPPHHHPHPSHR